MYKVLVQYSDLSPKDATKKLEQQVNEYLRQGWRLQGGVQTTKLQSEDGYAAMQAIVKAE